MSVLPSLVQLFSTVRLNTARVRIRVSVRIKLRFSFSDRVGGNKIVGARVKFTGRHGKCIITI